MSERFFFVAYQQKTAEWRERGQRKKKELREQVGEMLA